MIEILEKLFRGQIGNIFLFGLFLILSLVVFIIVTYQFDPNLSNNVTAMFFSNLLVGRVPSLSLGYAAEQTHLVVIATNVVAELILVSIIYPLFVLSFQGILKVKVLENFFNQVKHKREEHQEEFDKYGKLGLFVFVFIPFWMTGPIVGSIIGFLIGIKHYTVMTIVFVSTAIAISLWGLFLQEIIDFLMVFGAHVVWGVILLLVLALLVFRFRKVILDKIRQITKKGE